MPVIKHGVPSRRSDGKLPWGFPCAGFFYEGLIRDAGHNAGTAIFPRTDNFTKTSAPRCPRGAPGRIIQEAEAGNGFCLLYFMSRESILRNPAEPCNREFGTLHLCKAAPCPSLHCSQRPVFPVETSQSRRNREVCKTASGFIRAPFSCCGSTFADYHAPGRNACAKL